MNKYVANISYGKDSIAMLEIIHRYKLPLERIIHCDIWATDTVSAKLPPMLEFSEYADKVIKQRYGIEVEHVRSSDTFESAFKHVNTKGKHIGKVRGFPNTVRRWCVSNLKTDPLDKARRGYKVYVGYAIDETHRLHRLNGNKLAPLVEYGITEEEAFDICKRIGLLSPVYTNNTYRDGCWFCPLQKISNIKRLYTEYPEHWAILQRLENYAQVKHNKDTNTFRSNNPRTVAGLAERFERENRQMMMFT